MAWFRQLLCKHEWKHRFIVCKGGTSIVQHCWRCGGTKLATRFWPIDTDEILERHDTKEWLADLRVVRENAA
jgi:hypothetical protein